MSGKIDAKLKELGIELPQAAAPVAAYVPVAKTGSLLFVSGQITVWNGEKRFIGKVGAEISPEQAKQAARLSGLNIIAQVKAALDGDLDRVKRVVKLDGFVNAVPEFAQQPAVINGASELMAEVFGEAGKHARSAVGVASLPFNVAVEVDAVFEIA